MRTHSLASLTLLAIALASSCAPNAETMSGLPRIAPASLSSDALYEDEIARAGVVTAYEALARLRPASLRRNRVTTPFDGRAVYLDGLCIGGLEQLAEIPATHVHEIRFISSIEATGRYGRVPTEGIIMITTKLGPR